MPLRKLIPALSTVVIVLLIASCSKEQTGTYTEKPYLQVLFLGDDRGHEPSVRLRDIARPMLDRGIHLYYTSDINDINPQNLAKYDAVLLYANYHEPHFPVTPPEIEDALIGYVENGGGFLGIHAASGNFRDSQRYIEMLGGAFESHGADSFRTRIAEPGHEIMQGFEGFESWDETYVHSHHNEENRTVLSYRDDEPYTWIRNHGNGRVFYSAWGHDQRTWQNPGFHDLLERGIRWAAGRDVQAELASRQIGNPFEYTVLDVPFPPPHEERLRYEEEVGPMDRGANNPRYYRKQLPVDPEIAIDRMIVPAGFRVELFASEPDIVNPISMNWDEQGRLWVIESIEYPYPRGFWPDGGGKDRIIILEDTNRDGRADKFTVFADGLNIPTSLVFYNDGVIVNQAPETLFLKDTTGDGKADHREVLFDGWHQWDTHAGPNNMHYGLDNQIWGVLGYAGFDGTVGGEHHEFRMGVYRFKPDGSKLEFLRRTNNNTWGLGFNEQGDVFISTANGNPSTWFQFPQRHYGNLSGLDDSVTGRLTDTARIITLTNLFRQVDWVGAFTSAAGHALYTARTYPEEYWNRIAFVTEPTVQLVAEVILEENGSGFRASHPRNLVASDDEWFSPVQAEVGPDGHIWIADWYNYIIQHNAESDRQEPTPGNAYANPLRDRQHGRIYRIVYEGAGTAERFTLAGARPQKLVSTLSHENMFWRKHAQRLLVERSETDVVPQLTDLISDRSADETGLNAGAIHALWTLHGLGVLDQPEGDAFEAAVNALLHPSSGVRKNAIQVLPAAAESVTALLEYCLIDDPDMQVRLAAIVALADMPPSHDAGAALFNILGKPENLSDRWIREAGALAAAVHNIGFLAAADAAGMLPDTGTIPADPSPEDMGGIIAMVLSEDPEAVAHIGQVAVTALPPAVDRVLQMGVIENEMRFDLEELRVQAGQTIRIDFVNTDNMEHNLLILNPGTLAEVGRLADEMITAPDGRQRMYVPDSPAVLASTPLLDPGESYQLIFRVPDEPGEYPFVCTIPGHWRIMNGIMIVE
jgi:uncharacterized protein